jgi:predicted RNase H-like HicB family nuclease
VETVHVIYRRDEDTWVAESPQVPGWTAVADTLEEGRELAEEGVRFALDRDDLDIVHAAVIPSQGWVPVA